MQGGTNLKKTLFPVLFAIGLRKTGTDLFSKTGTDLFSVFLSNANYFITSAEVEKWI